MKKSSFYFTIVIVFLSINLMADDTWKKPLSVKEKKIEIGIQQRHNILGLYPSKVEIPRDRETIDITTSNPYADIQHAVCWTANYLAGLSYKYAFLKSSSAPIEEIEAAKRRADEVFEAVYRCQLVTGIKGLQARGYFLGHGESYAERHNSTKLPYWRQGEIDDQSFRWIGDPSHHNYSDSIHGLGQYYDLAAEGDQKDRAREAIDALVSYWVDNDLKIAKYDKSLPDFPILGVTDGKTLNTRVMMAIAGAKVAHYATKKEKFKLVYDRLIDQYGVRNLATFKTGKGFDDAEHVFCHLDLLFRIEKDPELLNGFRKVADGLWENHKNDAQSLFTYIYYAIAPDAPDREKALNEALFSLRTFPTDMTIKPRMNSLNPDLKPPYPTYLADWDNEYIWKANLLRPDGWLSRNVIDVAVSPEDPMVIYAVDENGSLYQSRDGASSWQNWIPIDHALHSRVRKVKVGRRSRILIVACDDRFYLTTTAGSNWKKLPIPSDGGQPIDVVIDPRNSNVIFAITTKNIYRSRDFGEEYFGQSWELLSDNLPSLSSVKFYVAHGDPDRIYAVSDRKIFTRKLDSSEWTRGTDFGTRQYTEPYSWLLIDPSNSDHVIAGFKTTNEIFGTLSILQESFDAGETWTNDESKIYNTFFESGIPGIVSLGVISELNHTIIDPSDPNVIYAGADRGITKSANGGKKWKKFQNGFNIPLVRSLIGSRHSSWLFAGTPGGLYISKDRGETWEDGNLWLQFTKNTRHELGGASFIDAYWRARFHGFIDDQIADTF